LDRFRYLSVRAIVHAKINDPLSYFPRRGKDYSAPSPVGEGWEGGEYPAKIITFYLFNSY
jgi:hypothetical protein